VFGILDGVKGTMNLVMRKGQANMVASVILLVTVVILLFISLLVVSKVRSSVHSSLYNDSYNATSGDGKLDDQDAYVDVRNNSSTAFTLMAIALIVLVAFLIISILRGGA
jgi:hypothetical protein